MSNKKIPPLAIVGGGCLVIIIVGIIGIAFLLKKGTDFVKDFAENPAKIAELAVKGDPNLEFIDTDDSKGTITYRDKRTGKETTIDWNNIKNGKITVQSGDETTTLSAGEGTATIETPDGTSTFGVGGLEKMPKWFEVPEGIGNWKSVNHTEQAGGRLSGLVLGESGRPLAELVSAFESNVTVAGFVRKSKTEIPDRVIAVFDDEERKRSLTVTVFKQKGQTTVSLGYAQR